MAGTVDAFSRMTAALAGTAPPALATRAEAAAARLGRLAELARTYGGPELAPLAEGIEHWLSSGGNLGALLGAKARRGRRNDLPAYAAAEGRKRDAVLQMVQVLELDGTNPNKAGKALAAVLADPVRGPLILRELAPGVAMPTSSSQLTRILRGSES